MLPTVIEPLRQEWTTAQAAAARQLEEGKSKEARAELVRFLNRLTSIKILDPACGSGNFLYVTLEHLKRLEGEVLAAINSYGQTVLLNLSGGTTVSPRQLLGLELNPRAAAIADVVLKIGYLQWHLRTQGESELREPLLDEYENIHQQDAVLQHDPPVPRLDANGQPVTRWDGVTTKTHPATGLSIPDDSVRITFYDYPNPSPAEWPKADFIVGNPPFLGPAKMREALGDGYAEALRLAYKNQVSESTDLVMYWWYKAAELLQHNSVERFGFITTNSLKQVFSRRVLQRFMDNTDNSISLVFAVPDHPWIDSHDGAAVRVSMTIAQTGKQSGLLSEVVSEYLADDDSWDVSMKETMGIINTDLTIGADVTGIKALKANLGICNRGMIPAGQGFTVTKEVAKELGLGIVEGLERHIRPYRNGKDLMAKSRDVLVIDLFGLNEKDVITQFPEVYQHLLYTVKPQRDEVRRDAHKKKWWIFGEPRATLRPALDGLRRYIATVYVSKYKIFMFVDGEIMPDDGLIAIGSDDAYLLGVLSSKIHNSWALATGGRMGVGNDPRYNNSRCFDPFPFPDAAPAQKALIRELAEQLDAHRKRQQAQYATLTLTDLYNVIEKLRSGETLTVKDHIINQQGLASVVLSLHQQLDAAVADVYGWPVDLPEAEILTRLVKLNQERVAEEEAGQIRYLRPEYQAPGQQQLGIDLGKTAVSQTVTSVTAEPQEWPKELAGQMQVIRTLIHQANGPISAAQVASHFKRVNVQRIQPLLDTLTTLSLLRRTSDGTYAV